MARARTGSVVYVPPDKKKGEKLGHYKTRITLEDGSRPWIHLDPGPQDDNREAWAREQAKIHTDRARRERRTASDFGLSKRAPVVDEGETCSEFHDRLLLECVAEGQTNTSKKACQWNVWIAPTIGHLPIRSITRDQVEAIRDALDDAARQWAKHGEAKGRLAPKSAQNVWSELTSTMAAACSSKKRELRVLTVNPCTSVLPPDRGATRRKPFIYPSEFLSLVTCDDSTVSREWKELHTIAVYTYLRPGELRVLRWTDVDLDHGIISVSKAWDYDEGKLKDFTKTPAGVRRVPIDPNLLPLLKRMRDEARAEALVVPLLASMGADYVAEHTRDHLAAAGVVRAELHKRTATTIWMTFRGWRDTGITWACIAGVDIAKIQARAGHETLSTTMGYVKAAESLDAGFGQPFPPLPDDLVGEAESSRQSSPMRNPAGNSCEGGDLNPYGVTR